MSQAEEEYRNVAMSELGLRLRRDEEIQRLKEENKWYSAVVNYCVGRLPRKAFETLLDTPRKELLARHKAEQAVIEAARQCSSKGWTVETASILKSKLQALDAAAPRAGEGGENG